MKKISKIIISVLLVAAILVPTFVFVTAETTVNTTPNVSADTKEYYNLKDGIYTKKSVSGPNEDGTYDVTIDSYTSDVRYISADKTGAIDIMVLLDNSQSMGSSVVSGAKAYEARKAIQNVFSALINNYGADEKYTANVCVYTFSNKPTHRLGYRTLTKDNLSDINKTVKNIMSNTLIGGTDTAEAFEEMYNVISERQRNNPQNTQVLLFLTDGVPSEGASGFNEPLGRKYANNTLPYAEKLKALGVSIYCLGINSDFEPYKQNENTLSTIVTDGYNSNGKSKDIRRATLFLNMVSSGWTADTARSFEWGDNDNSEAKNYYNNSDKGKLSLKYYRYWANSNDSWQMIPSYYTQHINEDNPTAQYYYGKIDASSIADNLSEAVMYSISSHYISQGSLLGDYTIKDTVSDYFEVIPNTTKIYKVPYAATKNADGTWSNAYTGYDSTQSTGNTQYGESNRGWGTPVDITDNVNYTETTTDVTVTAYKDSASVVDTCVVDDTVDKNNETHSGNKLRLTFKIKPKDSFIGASSVPTNDPANSGIFKGGSAVQQFVDMTLVNGTEKINYQSPTRPVPLSEMTATVSDDNVKIGMLYSLDSLGDNYSLTYKGRFFDKTYSLKEEEDGYAAYDGGEKIVYRYSEDDTSKILATPTDYIVVVTRESYNSNSNIPAILNSNYIQFTGTGVTHNNSNVYSKEDITLNKRIYVAFSQLSNLEKNIIDVRFADYNQTGNDSQAEENNGIKDFNYYRFGVLSVREFTPEFTVNVYVPKVITEDVVADSGSGKWPVNSFDLTSAFDACNITSLTFDNNDSKFKINGDDTINASISAGTLQDMTSCVPESYDYDSDGETETLFTMPYAENGTLKFSDMLDKNNVLKVAFVADAFGLEGSQTSLTGFIKGFVDKDGNLRTSNDLISDKDQLKYTLMYNELFDVLYADKDMEYFADTPFRYTVDEFYATNKCEYCQNAYMPQYTGYQAQVHMVDSSIVIKKTGCDNNHLNESFVFTVVGLKENSAGDGPDLNTATVLTNLTIQGNGQKTVAVNPSEYPYYYVVEDTATNEHGGWTWDYTSTTINNASTNGWKGLSADTVFKINLGESAVLNFNNTYNNDMNTLHYASAYSSNIMSFVGSSANSSN